MQDVKEFKEFHFHQRILVSGFFLFILHHHHYLLLVESRARLPHLLLAAQVSRHASLLEGTHSRGFEYSTQDPSVSLRCEQVAGGETDNIDV